MATTDVLTSRTSSKTRLTIGLIVSASVLAFSACSSDGAGTRGTSIVEVQSDYPGFSQKSLIREATLIVEGRVVSTEPTVLKPRFEGDSAQEDPLLGLSDEERQEALAEDDGVVATAVTVEVDVAHRGQVQAGQRVTIIQTGGVLDGVTYKDGNIATLDVGSNYLLFGGDSFDGAYYVLGGGQQVLTVPPATGGSSPLTPRWPRSHNCAGRRSQPPWLLSLDPPMSLAG